MQHIGTLADAIITSEGDDAALRLLPFIGFAQSNTVVTRYARPLRPLLYLYGTQGPRWRLAARCLPNAHLGAACARARNRQLAGRRVPIEQLAAAAIPWPAPKRGTAVLERPAARAGRCYDERQSCSRSSTSPCVPRAVPARSSCAA
ncbi:MAG TPA: hypothetical protein VGH75_01135 [Steroidobacteraceae bacterium]